MMLDEKVNILLVDDQAAKLLTYEAILRDLGENLLKATSGREALAHLLKSEIAVVLMDVCMPDMDGFQLAAMIREHPRFQKTAMIFISAIHLSEIDHLRGYEMGAVDYVPVPIVPDVLRAKVKVFSELYRKTRDLERLNAELEQRVSARTAELEASNARLVESERRRGMALVSGKMGSWDWDRINGDCLWDSGQCQIFGVEPGNFLVTTENVRPLLHQDDWPILQDAMERLLTRGEAHQTEFRIRKPDGEQRWCYGAAAPTLDSSGRVVRISGVTVDITDRKQTEERQTLLAAEVDHRAKNVLALIQSIVRLTRAGSIKEYVEAVEGRIAALSHAHTILAQSRWQGVDLRGLVEEELAPFRIPGADRIEAHGPSMMLRPKLAQTFALALHELATNAAKYGALSSLAGRITLTWEVTPTDLILRWTETGGPVTKPETKPGFGMRIITASIEAQLSGRVSFEWPSEGLKCCLSVPLSDEIIVPDRLDGDQPPSAHEPSAPDGLSVASPNRIMIVEDEALVALALAESIVELGCSVVGPFGRVQEATKALQNGGIDAAILDINLGGELVYPVADILLRGGIPFVFMTGYAAKNVDTRYANIPLLQKPVNPNTLRGIFAQLESLSAVA